MINLSYVNIQPRHITGSKFDPAKAPEPETSALQDTGKLEKFQLTPHSNGIGEGYVGLSREDLASIVLNKDGLYTEDEKKDAICELESRRIDAFHTMYLETGDYLGATVASIRYLDQAGSLERQTFIWNDKRAHTVSEYAADCVQEGRAPINFDIDSPLYLLLKSVHDRIRETPYREGIGYADYLQDPQYLAIRQDYEGETGTGFSFKI